MLRLRGVVSLANMCCNARRARATDLTGANDALPFKMRRVEKNSLHTGMLLVWLSPTPSQCVQCTK